MKNETKERLKKALKTTLRAIGLVDIEDEGLEQEEIEEVSIIEEPSIRLLRKTVELRETKLGGRIMNKIGLAEVAEILIPEYMLDENNNISSEINYDLIPEEQRELVKQVGPICLRLYEEEGQEVVKPVFLEREIGQLDLERIRNGKQIDDGYEICSWNLFANEFLNSYVEQKKQYISNLTINQIPNSGSLTQEGVVGTVETVDRRRQIIATSCLVAATIMICGLMAFGAIDSCNKIYNGEKPQLIYELIDPMGAPELYLPFSRK